MPQFTGGPAVRVVPNVSVELKWITDVAWFGKVDVFDSPNATVPILTQFVVDTAMNKIAAATQDIVIPIVSPLSTDTQYYFRISAVDPTGSLGDLMSPSVAPWTPFFTGAQVLTNVAAQSITTAGATVAWQGNVIGFGKVTFGTSSLSQTVQDQNNITTHALDLGTLQAGTQYQFRAANVHAIDGDELASATGTFTTNQTATTIVFTQPHAEPRVISATQLSSVSIRCLNQGNPIPGIVVGFTVDPGSAGKGSLSMLQATTDANGIATVSFTGSGSGLVKVQVTSANANNSPLEIPVVVK